MQSPSPECQLRCLPYIHQPVKWYEWVPQKRNRLRRIINRRRCYLRNLISDITKPRSLPGSMEAMQITNELQPGDYVYIRSRDEVLSTLDRWNRLNGCTFMEEMWPYCGTQQRILKQVKTFLDERDYLVKKCKVKPEKFYINWLQGDY